MTLVKISNSISVWKSFFILSFASTFVIFIAITVKERYDSFTDNKKEKINRSTNPKSIGLTLLSTFLATMLAYTVMYLIFGFQGCIITGA